MRQLASRYLAVTILLLSPFTCSVTAFAAPPSIAPPPLSLLHAQSPIAQMDDPELVRELAQEETLVDLQNIEFSRESLSVRRAIILSFVPGGGWSLIYLP